MSTAVKLGPADHGQPLSYEEFMAGDYQEGYQYEIINGRLYVSPLPNLPEDLVEQWLLKKLSFYSDAHSEIINHVTNKARVFVPRRRLATVPEPDLAAYCGFPLNLPFRDLRWQDVSPILVAEVLSAEDPDKDLVRNVELFLQVPSIKEYWLIDSREEPERPTMKVHRRFGKKWRIVDVAPGETYTTKLLPGFQLVLDPRK